MKTTAPTEDETKAKQGLMGGLDLSDASTGSTRTVGDHGTGSTGAFSGDIVHLGKPDGPRPPVPKHGGVKPPDGPASREVHVKKWWSCMVLENNGIYSTKFFVAASVTLLVFFWGGAPRLRRDV